MADSTGDRPINNGVEQWLLLLFIFYIMIIGENGPRQISEMEKI
jgi:hypothetical protein